MGSSSLTVPKDQPAPTHGGGGPAAVRGHWENSPRLSGMAGPQHRASPRPSWGAAEQRCRVAGSAVGSGGNFLAGAAEQDGPRGAEAPLLGWRPNWRWDLGWLQLRLLEAEKNPVPPPVSSGAGLSGRCWFLFFPWQI